MPETIQVKGFPAIAEKKVCTFVNDVRPKQGLKETEYAIL